MIRLIGRNKWQECFQSRFTGSRSTVYTKYISVCTQFVVVSPKNYLTNRGREEEPDNYFLMIPSPFPILYLGIQDKTDVPSWLIISVFTAENMVRFNHLNCQTGNLTKPFIYVPVIEFCSAKQSINMAPSVEKKSQFVHFKKSIGSSFHVIIMSV